MEITKIWRYPVKTLAGESLSRVYMGELGLEGDRIVHVESARGGVITSRTHPKFLGLHSSLSPEGEPLVDGQPWNSPEVAAKVVKIAGAGAELVRYEGAERFDILPLLVATDGAITAFGHDYRRLRPNIVIGGVEGMAERDWEGRMLQVGSALIGIQDLRMRCIMTSFDPDTQIQNKEITQGIYQRFEGKLALNCFVVQEGDIAVGDKVELV
ncbi:MAG: MOSC N-terminal beta barrel domain-containing protein [Armatimonadetes bacterium]|nr:MOSC N-terminal beta barrel domain-containing protein [Armatimonadota bacterium]